MDEMKKENLLARVLGDVDEKKLVTLPSIDTSREAIANFGQLMDMANGIDEKSEDFNASFSELRATTKEQSEYQSLGLNVRNQFELDLSYHGLSSLCSALGIPANYIRRCIETNNVPFAEENLNFWLRRADQRDNFLRSTDNRLHGFLSSRYTVLDDHEVLSLTNDILSDFPSQYGVSNGLVTPEMMKVRVVQQEKIIIDGDELSVGFDIRNSRVGKSSLDISLLIFRWACSNGMIVGGGQGVAFRKRHVGITRDDLAASLADTIHSLPDMVEYVKTGVERAQGITLNSTSIQNLVDKFKAEGLSKNAAGRIEEFMDINYNRTLYGFVNTITDLSKEYSLETREKMERFAGRVFESKVA